MLLGLTRFLGLSAWGLWVDEAHTLHDAMWMFDTNPQDYPLGYLAVRAVIKLFGGATDEATLRLFPALCGYASIPLAAWALRPAIGPRRAAAVALLLSVSSWHLFWSQSARAYTLALCLSLLGGGLWLRGLLDGRPLRLSLGLGVVVAAALAHPSAGLLLPAMLCAPLLVGPLGARLPSRPPVLLLGGAALLGALALGGWGATVWRTYQGVKGGSSLSHLAMTTGWYMTPVVLAGAAGGAWIAWRRRSAGDLLLVGVVLGVGTLAAAASFLAKVAAQYVFVLLPWVAALATLPLARARSPLLRHGWIALLALLPVLDTGLYFTLRHGDRPRWKEAFAFVHEQRGPQDLVLAMHAPVAEYYLQPGRTWLRTQEGLVRLDEFSLDAPDQWLRRGRRLWIVFGPEDLAAWSPDARHKLLDLLEQEGRLAAEFDVPLTPRDMRVQVYVVG